jgi:hypothetical protein
MKNTKTGIDSEPVNVPTAPSKPRLARFSIGRLYNLGNYEHVRYELTVEVPPECSAKDAFLATLQLLHAADPHPPCTKREFEEATKALAKPAAELDQYELKNIELHKKRMKARQVWEQNRKLALEALDRLGGKVEYKEAQDNWPEYGD